MKRLLPLTLVLVMAAFTFGCSQNDAEKAKPVDASKDAGVNKNGAGPAQSQD